MDEEWSLIHLFDLGPRSKNLPGRSIGGSRTRSDPPPSRGGRPFPLRTGQTSSEVTEKGPMGSTKKRLRRKRE